MLASLTPHALARVPVEARAGAWLAGQARWGDLERYLALRAERPGDFPTLVERDRVAADLPGVDWAALRVPPPMLEVGPEEARITCSVRRVRWPVEDDGVTLAVDLFVGLRRVTLERPVIRSQLGVARPHRRHGRHHAARPRDRPGPRRRDIDRPRPVTARVPLAALAPGTWALRSTSDRRADPGLPARAP